MASPYCPKTCVEGTYVYQLPANETHPIVLRFVVFAVSVLVAAIVLPPFVIAVAVLPPYPGS